MLSMLARLTYNQASGPGIHGNALQLDKKAETLKVITSREYIWTLILHNIT